MMLSLRTLALALALILSSARAHGQLPSTTSKPVATNESLALTEGVGETQWSFSASAYAYLVTDSREYVQPTFTADRRWLHLEARYNYEDLETGSAWVGYNFGGGKKLAWEFTPMLGGVFGNTTGIAPGYKGSVNWWKLELYSEGEIVLDAGDWSESFFYNWSELTPAPVEWFRFGLVTQRTRAYQTDRDIQRGLLVGFSHKQVDLTTCWFNLDQSKPTVAVALSVSF
jgi:hypothetical protein